MRGLQKKRREGRKGGHGTSEDLAVSGEVPEGVRDDARAGEEGQDNLGHRYHPHCDRPDELPREPKVLESDADNEDDCGMEPNA